MLVLRDELVDACGVGAHTAEARGGEQRLPLVRGTPGEERGERLGEGAVVGGARLGGGEAGVGGEVGAGREVAEALPLALYGQPKEDPALGGGVEAPRRVQPVEVHVGGGARGLALVRDEVVGVGPGVRPEHVDEHLLARPEATTRVEAEEGGGGDDDGGVGVGVELVRAGEFAGHLAQLGDGRAGGGHALPHLHEGAAQARAGDGVGGGAVGAGTEAPVAVHVDVDELGADRLERLVANAEPLGDAGTVVVDEDVGLAGKGLDDLLALGTLQVEGDALLAAVAAGSPDGGDAHAAEGIAADGLDLDDARAEVGEDGGPEGGGDDRGELEDGDAAEGRGGGGGSGGDGRARAGALREDGFRVLARLGAGFAGGAGGGGEAGEGAELAHGSEGGVLALDDVPVENEVGVVEGVLGALEGGGGHAAVFDESLHPLIGGVLEGALEHAITQALAGVLGPLRGAALVVGVGEDVGEAGGGQVVVEEVCHEVAELEPASVPGLEGVVVERGHAGITRPAKSSGKRSPNCVRKSPPRS